MAKRLLGIFLALAIVVGMMPLMGVSVLADSTEQTTEKWLVSTEDELAEAILAGGTVVLMDDIAVTYSHLIEKNVTIDLNGYIVSVASDATDVLDIFRVRSEEATLTITDTTPGGLGTIDASNAIDDAIYVYKGTLILENGYIKNGNRFGSLLVDDSAVLNGGYIDVMLAGGDANITFGENMNLDGMIVDFDPRDFETFDEEKYELIFAAFLCRISKKVSADDIGVATEITDTHPNLDTRGSEFYGRYDAETGYWTGTDQSFGYSYYALTLNAGDRLTLMFSDTTRYFLLGSKANSISWSLPTTGKTIDIAESDTYLLLTSTDVAHKAFVTTAYDIMVNAVEQAKDELNEAIANKADIDTVNAAIDALNAAIDAAKQAAVDADAATKEALDQAIIDAQNAAIEAADKALADVKAELSAAMAQKADISTLNAAIIDVKQTISLVQKTASRADERMEAALSEAIDEAKQAAIDAAEAAVEFAVETLSQEMKQGDEAALAVAIDTLNAAIDTAKATLENADDELYAELASKIESADAALSDALAQMKADFADEMAALEAKDQALSDALAQANAELDEALDGADFAKIMAVVAIIAAAVSIVGNIALLCFVFFGKRKV